MKQIYNFRNRHCKILIEVLAETTLIQVYKKGNLIFSSISENSNSEELRTDIKDVREILYSKRNKTARRWFNEQARNVALFICSFKGYQAAIEPVELDVNVDNAPVGNLSYMD